jgi:translocator protein
MQKPLIRASVTTLFFLGVLAVNALANILPINGMNTGQVSALYPSLFTPAGITFSIWSLIYLLLAGFVILQWIKLRDERIGGIVMSITPLFVLSSVFNMTWIIAWHYLYVWTSVLIMLGLLTSLTLIFLRLQAFSIVSFVERVFIVLPFTIYFAWICVATIANLSTALISIEWNGFGLPETTWTLTMMVIAFALAAYITLRYLHAAFAGVVIWALAGIYMRWNGDDDALIAQTAIVLAVLLTVVFIYVVRKPVRTN